MLVDLLDQSIIAMKEIYELEKSSNDVQKQEKNDKIFSNVVSENHLMVKAVTNSMSQLGFVISQETRGKVIGLLKSSYDAVSRGLIQESTANYLQKEVFNIKKAILQEWLNYYHRVADQKINMLQNELIHYMNHAVLYKEVGDGQYISIKGKLYLFSDKIGFYGGSDTYEILLDDIVAIMEFEGIPIILEVLTNGENLYISTPNTEVLFKVLHTIESSKSEDDMKYMKIETTIEKIIEGADLDSYIFYFEDVQHSQICEDMEKQIGILIEKLHKLSTALEKYPDKVEGTHRFSNYYLPETLRLIFAHQQYLTAGVSKEQIDKVYIKVMESIDTVITAVERKIDSIYQVATMDTIAKANALQKIMGQDGYVKGEKYYCEMDEHCTENVINMMTNEFPTSAAKKTYAQCVFLKKEQDDYGISDVYGKMLENPEFCVILEELVDFGISRYKVNYSYHYQDTNLVLYQKYTYEDACRLLNWERNEVPLNIGGYKYDKKTKTFPIFINYDKQDNISDTTKYEDHFVAENRLIAISKSGRSMDSEDVQNFLNATERGIDVQLFVRKNKDDKISKEFYYLGRVIATGNAKQFVMPNTDKTAVEIEWELETPVREDIYQYIVNE